jgi:hypothetical protein
MQHLMGIEPLSALDSAPMRVDARGMTSFSATALPMDVQAAERFASLLEEGQTFNQEALATCNRLIARAETLVTRVDAFQAASQTPVTENATVCIQEPQGPCAVKVDAQVAQWGVAEGSDAVISSGAMSVAQEMTQAGTEMTSLVGSNHSDVQMCAVDVLSHPVRAEGAVSEKTPQQMVQPQTAIKAKGGKPSQVPVKGEDAEAPIMPTTFERVEGGVQDVVAPVRATPVKQDDVMVRGQERNEPLAVKPERVDMPPQVGVSPQVETSQIDFQRKPVAMVEVVPSRGPLADASLPTTLQDGVHPVSREAVLPSQVEVMIPREAVTTTIASPLRAEVRPTVVMPTRAEVAESVEKLPSQVEVMIPREAVTPTSASPLRAEVRPTVVMPTRAEVAEPLEKRPSQVEVTTSREDVTTTIASPLRAEVRPTVVMPTRAEVAEPVEKRPSQVEVMIPREAVTPTIASPLRAALSQTLPQEATIQQAVTNRVEVPQVVGMGESVGLPKPTAMRAEIVAQEASLPMRAESTPSTLETGRAAVIAEGRVTVREEVESRSRGGVDATSREPIQVIMPTMMPIVLPHLTAEVVTPQVLSYDIAQQFVLAAQAVADAMLVSSGFVNGEGQLFVRLRSDVLGGSEVRLVAQANTLTVVVNPASQDVQAIVEANRTQFEQYLAEKVQSWRVSVVVKRGGRDDEHL